MGSLKCPLCCPRELSDKKDLINHLISIHSNLRCPLCKEHSGDVATLISHLQSPCPCDTQVSSLIPSNDIQVACEPSTSNDTTSRHDASSYGNERKRKKSNITAASGNKKNSGDFINRKMETTKSDNVTEQQPVTTSSQNAFSIDAINYNGESLSEQTTESELDFDNISLFSDESCFSSSQNEIVSDEDSDNARIVSQLRQCGSGSIARNNENVFINNLQVINNNFYTISLNNGSSSSIPQESNFVRRNNKNDRLNNSRPSVSTDNNATHESSSQNRPHSIRNNFFRNDTLTAVSQSPNKYAVKNTNIMAGRTGTHTTHTNEPGRPMWESCLHMPQEQIDAAVAEARRENNPRSDSTNTSDNATSSNPTPGTSTVSYPKTHETVFRKINKSDLSLQPERPAVSSQNFRTQAQNTDHVQNAVSSQNFRTQAQNTDHVQNVVSSQNFRTQAQNSDHVQTAVSSQNFRIQAQNTDHTQTAVSSQNFRTQAQNTDHVQTAVSSQNFRTQAQNTDHVQNIFNDLTASKSKPDVKTKSFPIVLSEDSSHTSRVNSDRNSSSGETQLTLVTSSPSEDIAHSAVPLVLGAPSTTRPLVRNELSNQPSHTYVSHHSEHSMPCEETKNDTGHTACATNNEMQEAAAAMMSEASTTAPEQDCHEMLNNSNPSSLHGSGASMSTSCNIYNNIHKNKKSNLNQLGTNSHRDEDKFTIEKKSIELNDMPSTSGGNTNCQIINNSIKRNFNKLNSCSQEVNENKNLKRKGKRPKKTKKKNEPSPPAGSVQENEVGGIQDTNHVEELHDNRVHVDNARSNEPGVNNVRRNIASTVNNSLDPGVNNMRSDSTVHIVRNDPTINNIRHSLDASVNNAGGESNVRINNLDPSVNSMKENNTRNDLTHSEQNNDNAVANRILRPRNTSVPNVAQNNYKLLLEDKNSLSQSLNKNDSFNKKDLRAVYGDDRQQVRRSNSLNIKVNDLSAVSDKRNIAKSNSLNVRNNTWGEATTRCKETNTACRETNQTRANVSHEIEIAEGLGEDVLEEFRLEEASNELTLPAENLNNNNNETKQQAKCCRKLSNSNAEIERAQVIHNNIESRCKKEKKCNEERDKDKQNE